MRLDKDNINIVYYHGNCCDGFTSAFIVWYYYKKKFSLDRANEIKYIPCTYSKSSDISIIDNKNVIMCDFSMKYNILSKIIKDSKSFLLIDHHKTAEKDLENIPEKYKIFDMKKSGAGLTWEYFFPNITMPVFVQYVQDRDIWTKLYENTDYFSTYIFQQPFEFEIYESMLQKEKLDRALAIGKNWFEYQQIIVQDIAKYSRYIIQIVNDEYKIVLYANSSIMKSDVGSNMLKYFPFGDLACIWNYDILSNNTYYSLRSTDHLVDASSVAKQFGGGGHRNASGCEFKGNIGSLPLDIVNDHHVLYYLVSNKWNFDKLTKDFTNINLIDKKLLEFLKEKCKYMN